MQLAINGGEKIMGNEKFPSQITIGNEEIEDLKKFLEPNQILSRYRGSWGDNFWGGGNIQDLEASFKKHFSPKNEYSFLATNSCTSALHIACGAIGLKRGDEVIVTPYSMTCSATAPMVWGAKPVFADIEYDHFCIDPLSITKKITSKTKAIIVVDLFGQPYDVEAINAIAKKHNLYVIEDAAQAIGSTYKGKYAGTLGDIGCYSFTQGKHLTAGEGGMMAVKDSKLFMKCALLRNHAEAIANSMYDKNLECANDFLDMYGFNMRMTEIQAIFLLNQIEKLKSFVSMRQKNAYELQKRLSKIPGIIPTDIREDCTHSYYVLPFHFDEDSVGICRDKFISAVKAELNEEKNRIDRGVPIGSGYIKPLYRFPLFKKKFIPSYYPNVERLQSSHLFITLLQNLPLEKKHFDYIQWAFEKVYDLREDLK